MTRWDEDRAERHLRSLELFGMRFGLEKMRRMMTVLEAPQRRFDSIRISPKPTPRTANSFTDMKWIFMVLFANTNARSN